MTNYLLLLKKRLSIRKQYETTLNVDNTGTMENADQLIDKFMNVVIDYDAYCETEENEVQRRREQAELSCYTGVQSALNNKVTSKMKEQP